MINDPRLLLLMIDPCPMGAGLKSCLDPEEWRGNRGHRRYAGSQEERRPGVLKARADDRSWSAGPGHDVHEDHPVPCPESSQGGQLVMSLLHSNPALARCRTLTASYEILSISRPYLATYGLCAFARYSIIQSTEERKSNKFVVVGSGIWGGRSRCNTKCSQDDRYWARAVVGPGT